VSHVRALSAMAKRASDPTYKAAVEFERGVLENRCQPASLSAAELQALRRLWGRARSAWRRRALVSAGKGYTLRLPPVGNRFLGGDLDNFRLRFERDASENVRRLVGLTRSRTTAAANSVAPARHLLSLSGSYGG
jgi:hypothetical protein